MLLVSAPLWPAENIRCDILSTAPKLGSFADALQAAGYLVVHFPFRSRLRLLPNPFFVRNLLELHRMCRYSVLHIHTEGGAPFFTLLGRLMGIPSIAITVHNTFRFTGFLRFRKSLERKFVRMLGGRYGMISNAVAACEMERFHNPGVPVRNWFDVEYFHPPSDEERAAARKLLSIPSDTTAIVSIGNCNHAKNHTALQKALSLLPPISNYLYLHIGREEDGAPERSLASELGIAQRTRFEGIQADVRPYLWAADLFVMPSLNEGLPIAALEALATGCPAILADTPGLSELKELAPGAIYVAPDPQLLANAIAQAAAPQPSSQSRENNPDSAAIRAAFSPAQAVRILVDRLYQLRPAAQGTAS